MRRAAKATFVALGAAAVVTGLVVGKGLRHGFSARDEPTAAEAWVARKLRILAIPALERGARNPVAVSAEVLTSARRHFADHCASCHANDGSGDTAIGKNLYPKAPDMRTAPTQHLSDGELFYIIRNGIRLSGMPAWGDGPAADDAESWGLVHFLRRLPYLSAAELAQMKQWNPVGRLEAQEDERIEKFLSGEGPADPSPSHHGQ
ncbi:MAG: cytochrome c [Deltaproteobacteria bacterium]|nr:cytochrome c [Deltaproteobacteria bacterium]